MVIFHEYIRINFPMILTCFMFLLRPTLLLFFYGLPYYFSAVLRAASTRVYHDVSAYCNTSMYHITAHAQREYILV